MGWLMRRAKPRAWAGWRDRGARPDEASAGPPWYVWGTIPHSARLVSGNLIFGAANPFVQWGGWSFEHTCFKPHWGVAFATVAPKSGTVAEIFRVILNKPSWASVQADPSNVLALDIQFRTAAVGSRAMITTYDGAGSAGNIRREATIPQSVWDGNPHDWLVQINDDSYMRVSLDGNDLLLANIPTAYRSGPGRRAANFMSQMQTEVALPLATHPFDLFDQVVEIPWQAHDWELVAADNFDRANGPVGAPWVEYGSNADARIVSNSYAWNSTNDGSRAILQPTGITSGRQKVTVTLGGASGPSSQDCSLVARANSAGTSGICANIFNNALYLTRLAGPITDSQPAFADWRSDPNTFTAASGDQISLCTGDNWAWVEQNGRVVLAVTGVDSLVPVSQSYCGLRVERHSFTNSASFNDVAIYDGT